jgi:drug/metabolite transporter (DMT)-like permease
VAIWLAILSSLCFGTALVTGRVGLRTLDARSGAAISIPAATILFVLAAPYALDMSAYNVPAAMVFAVVGVFFPAVVTLLTFRSNERLGPTVTSAVSGTAPLFALIAAGLVLGESIPAEAAVAAAGVVAGVALLSRRNDATRPDCGGWALLWPISGAAVRGLAQAGVKAGLLLWPNPFAAGLIGYLMSSAVVLTTGRLGRSSTQRPTKESAFWFAVTGVLNGGAVLLMYAAFSMAPVSIIAPIVAAYPLITALISTLVLHDDRLTTRKAAGAAITVASIAYLVAVSSVLKTTPTL